MPRPLRPLLRVAIGHSTVPPLRGGDVYAPDWPRGGHYGGVMGVGQVGQRPRSPDALGAPFRGGVFSTCPGTLFVRRAPTTLPLLLTDSVGGIASVEKHGDHARPACMHGARTFGLPPVSIDREFDGNRGLRATMTSGTRGIGGLYFLYCW